MLLADIASLFPSEGAKLKKTDFIRDRVATLLQFNKDGHLNQTISFVRQQLQVNLWFVTTHYI